MDLYDPKVLFIFELSERIENLFPGSPAWDQFEDNGLFNISDRSIFYPPLWRILLRALSQTPGRNRHSVSCSWKRYQPSCGTPTATAPLSRRPRPRTSH